jgi:transposase
MDKRKEFEKAAENVKEGIKHSAEDLLADEELSNDVIASRLDTPRQIVSKWRKRFVFARLPGLEAQPRGGRKARFSPQSRRSG